MLPKKGYMYTHMIQTKRIIFVNGDGVETLLPEPIVVMDKDNLPPNYSKVSKPHTWRFEDDRLTDVEFLEHLLSTPI